MNLWKKRENWYTYLIIIFISNILFTFCGKIFYAEPSFLTWFSNARILFFLFWRLTNKNMQYWSFYFDEEYVGVFLLLFYYLFGYIKRSQLWCDCSEMFQVNWIFHEKNRKLRLFHLTFEICIKQGNGMSANIYQQKSFERAENEMKIKKIPTVMKVKYIIKRRWTDWKTVHIVHDTRVEWRESGHLFQHQFSSLTLSMLLSKLSEMYKKPEKWKTIFSIFF